jgi:hypothetical protein
MTMPATADQAPMAPGRSEAGNTPERMDSVPGMTNAPPRPIRARKAIRVPVSPDSAEPTDPSGGVAGPTSTSPRSARRSTS